MTFAEIHWLPISISLLQSLFVIVCALMILIILMQRPKQEGLGAAFGGGVTDQVFGARTTNVLQRGTVYLGSMFFIISLALAVLVGQQNKTVKTVKKEDSAKVEKAVVPPAPEKPKSLTEELPPAPVVPPDSPAPSDVPPDASVPAPVTPAPNPVVPPSETAPTSPPAAPTESLPVTPPVAPPVAPPADKAPQL